MSETTVKNIVAIVIAVLVLVVVLIGAYAIFGERIISYFRGIVPGEEPSETMPDNIAKDNIVAYLIVDNEQRSTAQMARGIDLLYVRLKDKQRSNFYFAKETLYEDKRWLDAQAGEIKGGIIRINEKYKGSEMAAIDGGEIFRSIIYKSNE